MRSRLESECVCYLANRRRVADAKRTIHNDGQARNIASCTSQSQLCTSIAVDPLIRYSIHAQESANLPAVVIKFRSDDLYAARGKTQHVLLHDLYSLVKGL